MNHRRGAKGAKEVVRLYYFSTSLEKITGVIFCGATNTGNDYRGKVPDDMEALLSLPGVGRKTANCVLVYGFGKDAIAVDTHVHRISNRLGLVSTKTPEETELKLREVLSKKYWRYINELLVRFGQDICRHVGQKCGVCMIGEMCPISGK